MAFKEVDPLVQSLTNVPAFDKEKTQAYLKNYGDGFTDEHFVDWAKKHGKQIQPPKPLNPEFAKTSFAKQHYGEPVSYEDQYLNDDDYLKETWDDLWEEILDYHKESVGDK